MDTKLTGDISEKMVELSLLKQQIDVLIPVGDRLPYDRVAVVGNVFLKLQIRTAWYDKESDMYVGNVRNAKTNRKEYKFVKSNTKDVNFFVFVIQELNVFYVVPSSIIEKVKSAVRLAPHRKRRVDIFKIEFCKNNWDLLKVPNINLAA